MSPGETNHVTGRDGVDRAKLWLEKTGRVDVNFTSYDVEGAQFLSFNDIHDEEFSFDIAGVLHIASGKTQFFAEVKNVTGEAKQGVQYRKYLAKCYRTCKSTGKRFHFVWLTWHPFSLGSWSKLCTAEEVISAVNLHKEQYVGDEDIDEDLCREISDRLWLIVLGEKQESLSMSDQMFGELKRALVAGVPR